MSDTEKRKEEERWKEGERLHQIQFEHLNMGSGENQTLKANPMMRELDGQMIVFAGISGDKLDSLLSLLRSNPACGSIPYKAVLTEMNQSWSAYALFEELKREHGSEVLCISA